LIHGTERFIRPPPETRLNNQVSQPQWIINPDKPVLSE
jgi:hypothetical protein